jgi:hypothetical protein
LFEKGGQYYTGKSIKTYKKGQTIDVYVELTESLLSLSQINISVFKQVPIT